MIETILKENEQFKLELIIALKKLNQANCLAK